jgi:hypothetical protein
MIVFIKDSEHSRYWTQRLPIRTVIFRGFPHFSDSKTEAEYL